MRFARRRHALHRPGERPVADGGGGLVHVAGRRAGGVAAVAVVVLGVRRGRVEVPGADQLVVADVPRAPGGPGRRRRRRCARAERVLGRVAVAAGGRERRVGRVDAAVDDADQHASPRVPVCRCRSRRPRRSRT